MSAKNWLSLVKLSHADPNIAGLIGGLTSGLPGGSFLFPGLYSGLSNESLGSGLRTGTRSFAEDAGGTFAGGAAGGIAGLLGGLLIKNNPEAAYKLLLGSGMLGGAVGGALGAMHGAQRSVENINQENSVLGRLGSSISKMGSYPMEKAASVADIFCKQASRGHFTEGGKPFLGDMATGVAWGLGGAVADKGVNALSHAFSKRKKPQTEDQESRKSVKQASRLLLAEIVADQFLKQAIIRQEGEGYTLMSHKGKVLGKHPSKAKAIAQEQAIKAHGG